MHKLVGNWGWAIVLLTILIKLLFFPLSAANYKSMAKMKAVTPRLNALKERYGDDKQKLNMEMMNLYKSEKINPLGGCLPIVIPNPCVIALYWALLGAVKECAMRPGFCGFMTFHSGPVLRSADHHGGNHVYQAKLNPTPDPIQAKVMMLMPIIFGAMFLFFPSKGLRLLYWVVNNVLSIAQQWQITRMISGGQAANDAKA